MYLPRIQILPKRTLKVKIQHVAGKGVLLASMFQTGGPHSSWNKSQKSRLKSMLQSVSRTIGRRTKEDTQKRRRVLGQEVRSNSRFGSRWDQRYSTEAASSDPASLLQKVRCQSSFRGVGKCDTLFFLLSCLVGCSLSPLHQVLLSDPIRQPFSIKRSPTLGFDVLSHKTWISWIRKRRVCSRARQDCLPQPPQHQSSTETTAEPSSYQVSARPGTRNQDCGLPCSAGNYPSIRQLLS
ncbi:hypothetical protein BJ166DRAFT_251370 [Pestalotiopsis sp. NC0098]|nr:hypothetical protein BJ166DRAFT_251370 [Pestalotiopsis sp. NC0098]